MQLYNIIVIININILVWHIIKINQYLLKLQMTGRGLRPKYIQLIRPYLSNCVSYNPRSLKTTVNWAILYQL